MIGGLQLAGFSEAERLILTERLYALLREQTAKYLAGDSTSLPVETAGELLCSLVHTLRLALSEAGLPERALLTEDFPALLRQGQALLQRKLSEARRLWERACMTAPPLLNACLRDTLKGLRVFFKKYDLWYFAHQIPCMIDYPLCVPVSDEVQGVDYILQWLRRLLVENWFLRRLPREAVAEVLRAVAADYEEYPLNLCEQPLINAVGLALLGRPPGTLCLTADDCRALCGLLSGGEDLRAALYRGVSAVAAALQAPKEAEEYLRAIMDGALPRINCARQTMDLRGFFACEIS